MDFFEAQARAKKRTARLVVLFAFAVLGTILASYVAGVLILNQTRHYRIERSGRDQLSFSTNDAPPLGWWNPRLFGGISLVTIAIVGIASLVKWSQFSTGGSAVAESVGGRPVSPQTTDLAERRLLNVVEEMAIASGIPVPAVYVLDDEPAINAFAAGLTTSDAVVAVTRGTLQKLTRDELQGVIGHEFSHILNGDMRLNVRLTALVFGILVLGLAGRGILWTMRHTRGSRDKNGGGILVALALIGVALLIIGYIGYFFGRLVQSAVSRQREFLADASAVQFTRNPAGVSGALKKIGGYALGSSIISTKSEAIGHFFFAQGFRSMLGGLWATHPPLEERIRAIDPQFDGKMFEPPQVVDVARESFATAGFAHSGQRLTPDEAVHRAFAAQPAVPALRPRLKIPFKAGTVMSSIGTITPEQIANAQLLIEATPEQLRAAAHAPDEAPALIYGLLLGDDPAVRSKQRNLIGTHAGPAALPVLTSLEPALQVMRPEQKLPLVQIALPTLRDLPPAAVETFIDTLDELVHADAHVSTFEFALQKLLLNALALGRKPGPAVAHYHSFNAVAEELSIVLSALARAAVSDPDFAERAFAAGAEKLALLQGKLHFVTAAACDLAALDRALDKLAAASLPIKRRALVAATHVVSADGQVLISEFELLRAIAAALDVPVPPIGAAAA
jgi:Zn-dependent protease with chaperone function